MGKSNNVLLRVSSFMRVSAISPSWLGAHFGARLRADLPSGTMKREHRLVLSLPSSKANVLSFMQNRASAYSGDTLDRDSSVSLGLRSQSLPYQSQAMGTS